MSFSNRLSHSASPVSTRCPHTWSWTARIHHRMAEDGGPWTISLWRRGPRNLLTALARKARLASEASRSWNLRAREAIEMGEASERSEAGSRQTSERHLGHAHTQFKHGESSLQNNKQFVYHEDAEKRVYEERHDHACRRQSCGRCAKASGVVRTPSQASRQRFAEPCRGYSTFVHFHSDIRESCIDQTRPFAGNSCHNWGQSDVLGACWTEHLKLVFTTEW